MLRFVENPVTIRTEPLRLALAYNRTTVNQIGRASRRIAPVDRSPHRRPGPHLNRSINTTNRITGPTDIEDTVGSELNHALVAHTGAIPHQIRPRRPGGRMEFFWEKRGRWVSLSRVSHPGMDGVQYLTIPLFIIGTARDYRVVLF